MEQGDTYDITIEQGATWREVFTYAEPDGTTPIDLTGWTGKAQVRRSQDKGSLLLADLDIAIDGPAGEVTASLSATATDAIASSGFYDIELSSGDEVVRLVQGKAILNKAVTQ